MMRKFSPPPTKFGAVTGPGAPVQAKMAAAPIAAPRVPPPPTRFGAPSVQAKPSIAVPQRPWIDPQAVARIPGPSPVPSFRPPPVPAPVRSVAIQRMLSLKDMQSSQDMSRIPIRYGLVRGTYEQVPNKADLHVDAKGDGPGLSLKDMCDALEELHGRMTERHQQGGPSGVVEMHPTGAAIVKIVVEILGEVFGSGFNKYKARAQKAYRKNFGKKSEGGSSEKLLPNVLDEHFSYIDSLVGSQHLSIVPQIAAHKAEYKQTLDDYNQNMLENSALGRGKLQKYKGVLRDESEPMGPGLRIEIPASQIPAAIKLLRENLPKQK